MKVCRILSLGLVAAEDYLTFDDDFVREDYYGLAEKLEAAVPAERDCCRTLKVYSDYFLVYADQ